MANEGVVQLAPRTTVPLVCGPEVEIVGVLPSQFGTITSDATNGVGFPMAGDSADSAARVALPFTFRRENTAPRLMLMRINNVYAVLPAPPGCGATKAAATSMPSTNETHRQPEPPTIISLTPTQPNTSSIVNQSLLQVMVCGVAEGATVPPVFLAPGARAEIRGQKHVQLLVFAGTVTFAVPPGTLTGDVAPSSSSLAMQRLGTASHARARSSLLPLQLAVAGDVAFWLAQSHQHGPSSYIVVDVPSGTSLDAALRRAHKAENQPSTTPTVVVPIIHTGIQPRVVLATSISLAAFVVGFVVFVVLFIVYYAKCRKQAKVIAGSTSFVQ
jgi:hypothetical protein